MVVAVRDAQVRHGRGRPVDGMATGPPREVAVAATARHHARRAGPVGRGAVQGRHFGHAQPRHGVQAHRGHRPRLGQGQLPRRAAAAHAAERSVWTMGRAKLVPNATSIIPGYAELDLQFRDASESQLDRFTALAYETAEEIARPISQVPRVVATIVPFDIDKLLTGEIPTNTPHLPAKKTPAAQIPDRAKSTWKVDLKEVSHYQEDLLPIGKISWRKRANVLGRVTAIRPASMSTAPTLEVEIWDETGGVTLQFLGRREIAGLEVGSLLQAEGMVGEQEGSLTILNPSYEIRS